MDIGIITWIGMDIINIIIPIASVTLLTSFSLEYLLIRWVLYFLISSSLAELIFTPTSKYASSSNNFVILLENAVAKSDTTKLTIMIDAIDMIDVPKNLHFGCISL